MPFNAVALRGIPITGTVVKLATTPGRWAAAPAPAIKAIAPSAQGVPQRLNSLWCTMRRSNHHS